MNNSVAEENERRRKRSMGWRDRGRERVRKEVGLGWGGTWESVTVCQRESRKCICAYPYMWTNGVRVSQS